MIDSENNKQIAFVISTNTLGGHEFQSLELIKLAVKFCRVTVFVNSPIFESIFKIDGVCVILTNEKLFKPGKIYRQLINGVLHSNFYRKLFVDFDRVIVCAGTLEAGLMVGLGMLGSKKTDLYLPSLYDRKVIWGNVGIVYTCLLRVLTNLFSRIITINRIQAKLVSPFFFGDVFVVRNKIPDLELLTKSQSKPRLLAIGRLDKQKKIIELIEWLDTEINPFDQLLIIGDGPLRSAVEAAAEKAKYIKVSMLGWINTNDQANYIYSNDILMLNSVIEGEPMVIREANARGMSVIARDIPGVKGVTYRSNRYQSYAELMKLLKLASLGRLQVFPEPADARYEQARMIVAENIFKSF